MCVCATEFTYSNGKHNYFRRHAFWCPYFLLNIMVELLVLNTQCNKFVFVCVCVYGFETVYIIEKMFVVFILLMTSKDTTGAAVVFSACHMMKRILFFFMVVYSHLALHIFYQFSFAFACVRPQTQTHIHAKMCRKK